jgi:hypothetical protein
VTWDNPLYVRGYSQSVLNKALSADTQFLASQLVMDYSLLVGIDDDNNQLIVGLIGKSLFDRLFFLLTLFARIFFFTKFVYLFRLHSYIHLGQTA